MTKEEFKLRVEQAKDDTPSTGWFINAVALLFGGAILWAKIKGAV